MLLYKIFTGHFPFATQDTQEIFQEQCYAHQTKSYPSERTNCFSYFPKSKTRARLGWWRAVKVAYSFSMAVNRAGSVDFPVQMGQLQLIMIDFGLAQSKEQWREPPEPACPFKLQ